MKSKLDTGISSTGANHKCSTWGKYKCLWRTEVFCEAGNFRIIVGNNINTEAGGSLVYLWFTKRLLATPRSIYGRDEDGEHASFFNPDYEELEKQAKQFLTEIEK